MSEQPAVIGIVMGSNSDWPTMQAAARVLKDFGVPYEARVVSAHRTPDLMFEYAEAARGRGLRAIIAGAGGAAHLPGMLAAKTTVPVLGVPVQSKALSGLDSLLSIVQMPGGIPVGTLAIGKAGAINAALLAAAMLGGKYPAIREAVRAFRTQQTDTVLADPDPRLHNRLKDTGDKLDELLDAQEIDPAVYKALILQAEGKEEEAEQAFMALDYDARFKQSTLAGEAMVSCDTPTAGGQ